MEKGRIKKTLLIAGIVLAVILISISYFFVLQNIAQVSALIGEIVEIIMPFIIGAVIAYLLKSTCNFFERLLLKMMAKSKKLSPKKKAMIANAISIILAYIVWAAAILVLAAVVIFQVVDSITLFVHDLKNEYIDGVAGWILNLANDQEFVAGLLGEKNMTDIAALLEVSPDEKIASIVQILNNNGINSDTLGTLMESTDFDTTGIFTTVFSSAVNFVNTIINAVIGIIISVFLLIGRKVIAEKSKLLLHCLFKKEQVVNAIVEEAKFTDRMFGGFLEGKIIGSSIVGLVYYIVLELIGVPYAPLIAVLCGVTNIIPIFGPFIGAIPSGIIILAADYTKLIPFILFVWLYQMIDGYIIDPHIVGGNIKLSSIWVVFAVIFFGGLWGFGGLLVGVPVFAVIYDIIGKICAYALKKNGKYDLLVEFKKKYEDDENEKKKRKRKRSKKQPEPALNVSTIEIDETSEASENIPSEEASANEEPSEEAPVEDSSKEQ